MYYRLEYDDGTGVFAASRGIIDDDLLKKIRRKLWEPKILKSISHPKTKSWFTEAGFIKFKNEIRDILDYSEYYNRGLNLVIVEDLNNIISKGKIQVLQRL